MKKIPPTLLMVLLSFLSFSQTWFDVGLKGGYGLNLMYNKNYFSDNNFTPKMSFGYMYGGKVGFNFNEDHSVTMDVISSAFNQGYYYNRLNADSSRSNYSRSISFNSINILLLYRKMKAASYFEVGPQYSAILKATGNDDIAGKSDVSGYLAKSYYSLALGFGGFVVGTENFGVTIGFRFSYSLSDAISPEGKSVHFPSQTNYSSYSPTNPFTGIMVMELNYDLGFIAKAKCGKKTKFVMF